MANYGRIEKIIRQLPEEKQPKGPGQVQFLVHGTTEKGKKQWDLVSFDLLISKIRRQVRDGFKLPLNWKRLAVPLLKRQRRNQGTDQPNQPEWIHHEEPESKDLDP